MKKIEPQQLKLFLLDSGLISSKDLESAEKSAAKENKYLGDVLVKENKIKEDDLRRLEAYILGIPFVDLKKEKIDFEILSLIPEPIARTHNIVAYKKTSDGLEVAMLDPEDLETIDFIKKKLNFKIKPRLTDPDSIKNILTQYNKSLQAEFGDIIQKEAESLRIVSEKEGDSGTGEDLKKLAEEVPVVRIVDTLLRHAILQRASDIHIEPMEKEVVARYRIDGILHDAMVLPKTVAPGIIARIKVLSNLKLDEKRLPQDGRFKIELSEEKFSFRVSIMPVFDGEKAVMRILHENSKGFGLESLGFLPSQIENLHEFIRRPHGMILATGPTGSGKTTTLYTILEILNTPEVNIATIEDPIEYQIPRINQTQVKPDIGFSFSDGLRSLVRQDPDIIMVGEIRDRETASLAINAALTGHLVLSTLHTNSAAGTIPRLLDMKVEPFLLASTINVIIAQRLVRRLCAEREKYFLTKNQLENLKHYIDTERMLDILKKEKIIRPGDDWSKVPFYKSKESKECPDGYKDRIGIHEILKVTELIKNLVMSNSTSDDIEKQAKKEGMTTMLEDGIIKAVQGITTIEEILRVTRE
ncbi:GspE/PulE family protein [Patescibacteria group bacterium]|nr:GspE/PulE family protein [Patescibacteria group bacterium]